MVAWYQVYLPEKYSLKLVNMIFHPTENRAIGILD